MKTTFRTIALFAIISLSFVACNKQNGSVEPSYKGANHSQNQKNASTHTELAEKLATNAHFQNACAKFAQIVHVNKTYVDGLNAEQKQAFDNAKSNLTENATLLEVLALTNYDEKIYVEQTDYIISETNLAYQEVPELNLLDNAEKSNVMAEATQMIMTNNDDIRDLIPTDIIMCVTTKFLAFLGVAYGWGNQECLVKAVIDLAIGIMTCI